MTWGVSMPICRTGKPSVAASRWARTRRSPKVAPRWGITTNPSRARSISSLRRASDRSPLSATTRAATADDRTASSVSSSAAAARSAAPTWEKTGASLVFASPGTGALAITSSVHARAFTG